TLGLNVAIGKSWGDMKKMMLEEFCPDKEKGFSRETKENGKIHRVAIGTTTLEETIKATTATNNTTTRDKEIREHLLMPQLSRLDTRDTNLFVTIARDITTAIAGQLATTAEGQAILRKTVGGSQLQFVMNVEKRVTPGTSV
nr:hypothetical protein [Tanacetum cinerariifolium]